MHDRLNAVSDQTMGRCLTAFLKETCEITRWVYQHTALTWHFTHLSWAGWAAAVWLAVQVRTSFFTFPGSKYHVSLEHQVCDDDSATAWDFWGKSGNTSAFYGRVGVYVCAFFFFFLAWGGGFACVILKLMIRRFLCFGLWNPPWAFSVGISREEGREGQE